MLEESRCRSRPHVRIVVGQAVLDGEAPIQACRVLDSRRSRLGRAWLSLSSAVIAERAQDVQALRQVAEALADVENRRSRCCNGLVMAWPCRYGPSSRRSPPTAMNSCSGNAEEIVLGLGVDVAPAIPAGPQPGGAVRDRQSEAGKDRLGPTEARVELLRSVWNSAADRSGSAAPVRRRRRDRRCRGWRERCGRRTRRARTRGIARAPPQRRIRRARRFAKSRKAWRFALKSRETVSRAAGDGARRISRQANERRGSGLGESDCACARPHEVAAGRRRTVDDRQPLGQSGRRGLEQDRMRSELAQRAAGVATALLAVRRRRRRIVALRAEHGGGAERRLELRRDGGEVVSRRRMVIGQGDELGEDRERGEQRREARQRRALAARRVFPPSSRPRSPREIPSAWPKPRQSVDLEATLASACQLGVMRICARRARASMAGAR